jgi:energy-coupling factor transporter ATP-binding protein EcfA2
MRLTSIEINDSPPIRQFAIHDLSNVVVLAGPNGVGKTRLVNSLLATFRNSQPVPQRRIIVEATSPAERQDWGQSTLDTSKADDVRKLLTTLQKQKSRGKWESSVVQFESDRSIQQIQPFSFSWDVIDPFFEMVGWDTGFGGLKNRFQDTIHSIFRKMQSRRNDMATRAEELLKQGATSMALDFPDPLVPFKNAFAQLLAPKSLMDPEVKQQKLSYSFEGQTFPLDSLSSGEREVVNIVFDFILRNPSHSIVIFDEPELHLHPELSYKLLQTLQTIGDQNQFIFCTHSPEIITASLENSVVFISPPKATQGNQAIPVREDDDTHQALRLLGQSIGIVALGRRIVLVEGADTSLDKQLYGTILKSRFPNLVLVPSGGKQVIQSFSTVVDAVLNRTIWGVEFFMLCDRDAVPLHLDPTVVERGANARLKVLPRYHVENYFLDEHILAEVFKLMESQDSWLTDPKQIAAKLKELAADMVSYTAALMESASYRQAVGNVDVMPKGAHGKTSKDLSNLMESRAKSEIARLEQALAPAKVSASVAERMDKIQQSLANDSDDWQKVIPGKQLLARFAALAKIDVGRLKTLYVRQVELSKTDTFNEIISIFEHFSSS